MGTELAPWVLSAPWSVWAIAVPLAAGILSFVMPRHGPRIGLGASALILLSALGLSAQVLGGGPRREELGAWGAPLGIDLYADGAAALLVLMSALVGLATSVYALGYFGQRSGEDPLLTRRRSFFWPLWMLLWASLNALFLSADAFNLYVTLELLGLSAVSLVALAGGAGALGAAMRYLLVSLLGSLCYLLGVAILYGQYGVLDLELLGAALRPEPASWVAMGLMTVGLLLKTALFPLHFWLPPAHSSAPAPVSAVLSALVVKASFYLLLRLWFEVFGTAVTPAAAQLLGALGAAAVLWGALQALGAGRLKLLVAYSTVAQLGYLFLVFPLSQSPAAAAAAWAGALYMVLAHAFAKAAMFFSAGVVLEVAGHDRIRELDGIGPRLPLSMFALGLAAVSLVGLPPSGGFLGKWMLLNAALVSGQWWWVLPLIGGSLLAAAYTFRVLSHAFTEPASGGLPQLGSGAATTQWSALGLAVLAIVLGLSAPYWLALAAVGAPVSGVPLGEIAP